MADSMGIQGLRHLRARLAGELEQLTKANGRRRAKLTALSQKIAANDSRIVELTAQIEALGEAARDGFGVELLPPVPRRTYPKHHFTGWGGVTRAVLAELARANRVPQLTGHSQQIGGH